MAPYYQDTHPEMEALQIRLLQQTPPWRKMAIFCELYAATRQVAIQGIKNLYPNSSEDELRQHLADLLLGKELSSKVYGELEYD